MDDYTDAQAEAGWGGKGGRKKRKAPAAAAAAENGHESDGDAKPRKSAGASALPAAQDGCTEWQCLPAEIGNVAVQAIAAGLLRQTSTAIHSLYTAPDITSAVMQLPRRGARARRRSAIARVTGVNDQIVQRMPVCETCRLLMIFRAPQRMGLVQSAYRDAHQACKPCLRAGALEFAP
jgi:hypothetical protein